MTLSECDTVRLLLLGGNDQHARNQSGAAAYSSAGNLLVGGALSRHGFGHVVLAGHPEGHPGLGKDPAATTALLAGKAGAAVAAGHTVAVASQFCFDAQVLTRWLSRTHAAVLSSMLAGVTEDGAPEPSAVTYHIGVPGPTKTGKLKRIAEICEVPSLFLGSAFDILDLDGDGEVSEAELLAAAAVLCVAPAELSALYEKYSGADRVLQRPELAQLLVELGADLAHEPTYGAGLGGGGDGPGAEVHSVTGPSAFVAGEPKVNATPGAVPKQEEEVVWPEELVLALAAFCGNYSSKGNDACCMCFYWSLVAGLLVDHERLLANTEREPAVEVVVHVFPFGGVSTDTPMPLYKVIANGPNGRLVISH